MLFLGRNLMISFKFHLYTCRPAGALEFGISTFLQTCRPSGALECGVFTFLQTCGISIALAIHSFDLLGLKGKTFQS